MAKRIDGFFISGPIDADIEDKVFIHKVRNVLRKMPGDEITIFDGRGHEYVAVIKEMTRHRVILGDPRLAIDLPRPGIEVSLAFGLLKADHTDMILQRCTELGVDVFLPFISAHTATGIPRAGKTEHWQRVLEEATAQSRRLWIPELKNVCSFDALCGEFAGYERVLIGDPYSADDFSSALADIPTAVGVKVLAVVGPEGGLNETELSRGAVSGGRRVRISRFMLRAETAALQIAGLLTHYLEKGRV